VGERGYRYKQAQKKSQDRRQQAVEPHKMSPVNIALIEAKSKQEWSPEQVSGGLEVECGITTSLATIYLHVWANKHKGGDLYTHLRLYIADPYRFLQRVATKVK
jgi:IS30 family transposase